MITIDRMSPTDRASVTFVVHRGAIYSDLELFEDTCLVAAASPLQVGQASASGSARTDCAAEPR
jgi:hypothetical protein